MTKEAKIRVLEGRADLLEKRDPVGNLNIVKKLRRKIRKLENL